MNEGESQFRPPTVACARWCVGGGGSRSFFQTHPYLAEKANRLKCETFTPIKRGQENAFLRANAMRSLRHQLSPIGVSTLGECPFLLPNQLYVGEKTIRLETRNIYCLSRVDNNIFSGAEAIRSLGRQMSLIRWGVRGVPVLASKPGRNRRKRPSD